MASVPFEFSDRFRMNLRRLRRRAGLSQEELARLASLHRTEIGLLEQGERMPRIDTLLRLTASLEVTPNDLLDGIDWVPARDRAEGSFWTRSPLEGSRSERVDG